ncbi:hypothetical protein KL930_000261 [Ogataea haglerorum]|uniref:Pre-mRNA-splicing factor 38 n=1 Tax=Ogataea haglerorum TaxID=1937702 RepID=A0AAN6I109_9ASCO|nr:hypothetical protein KL951_002258 [Ogataea haglerorum]KAG7701285.1 hypothetical protein KL915_000316 [Ogataea haglerorum]KAG7706504.1 hypothetical protein KL950_003169 [Ogataea haglerorum]KAG7709243.1 hypothetical protein KL914_001633 [Ogataea haglerorum]KAG7717893.1 hypothetical protein KL913_002829 [Ogataea haglerorum]
MSVTIDRGLVANTKRVHGVHPVFLIEKILRERILDSQYWKRECQHADLLVLLDRGVELEQIGTYANAGHTLPTPFICLLLRLLQLQPAADIVYHLLVQKDFIYLTALAALYIRITCQSVIVYQKLEPLLADRRRLNTIENQTVKSIHLDEYIDKLLQEDKFFDMVLPRLIDRLVLEDQELLEPRQGSLQEESERMYEDEKNETGQRAAHG